MGKGGGSFPLGRCDYPNVGMCGALLAQVLIFLQTPFVHFLYVTGGRQLHQVVLRAFPLGTVDLLPFPLLGLGRNTQSQGFPFPG